jgi:mannose-6-phosphate isomerase-like protein (cupin superfamily)
MVQTIDRQTGHHYSWGNGCDGWHLLQNVALSVIEERMPPGTSEVRHYHREANQFFYVLRGVLQIDLEGTELTLSAGQGLHIEAGKRHQVHNRSASDVEFLVISNPPSHGDRVATDEFTKASKVLGGIRISK